MIKRTIYSFIVVLVFISFVSEAYLLNFQVYSEINKLRENEINSSDSNIHNSFEDQVYDNPTLRADCSCENGVCVKVGKKEECECLPGYGKSKDYVCEECNCGKDINCTISRRLIFLKEITCNCPDGFSLKQKECIGPCTKNLCNNGGTCVDVPGSPKGYKCYCQLGYTGSNCNTEDPCALKPCQNGGNCKKDGKTFNCTCKKPYTGQKCENDPCTSKPCLNGGACEVEGETFKCNCKKPYTGSKCETDPCTFKQCLNGGICKVEGENTKCICKTPFSGEKCENDPCTPKPCQNGGACKVESNAFKCSCKSPYTGEKCEIDPCTFRPCQNDGSCKVEGETFKCSCKIPYTGEKCENDPCKSKLCLNGGTCKVEGETTKCICKTPYTGKKCEENPCTSKPCQNGGTCNVVGDIFKCTCITPYAGEKCENDPCTTKPCLNNGECRVESNTFKCNCKTPFTGIKCETDPCKSKPCLNGGECKVEGKTYKCNCKAPFTGTKCEADPCTLKPCLNGGECRVEGKTFKCNCKTPFTGIKCETGPCNSNPCKNDGICEIDLNTFKCKCKSPFFGTRCEKDPCTKMPCLNGGTCKVEQNYHRCICQKPYSGYNCENEPCNPNPCKNGGICRRLENSYKCQCQGHFEGENCDIECECENGHCALGLSGELKCECLPEYGLYSAKKCKACECGKGASCTFHSGLLATTKKCICPPGFKEFNNKCVGPCNSNPCKNDGICEIDLNTFKCKCKSPFFGTRCEKDPCTKMPCLNGGTCKVDHNYHRCICKKPYSGYNCENEPCNPNPCKNGGICQRLENSYKCQCQGHFEGENCDIECECENGHCTLGLSGELKCECLPEYGLYSAKKCKACECGKGASCTFHSGLLVTTKKCICPPGFKEVNNKCVETTTTTKSTTRSSKSTSSQIVPKSSTWRPTSSPPTMTTASDITSTDKSTVVVITETLTDYFESTRDIKRTDTPSKFTQDITSSSESYKSTSKIPRTFSTGSSSQSTHTFFISSSKFTDPSSPGTVTEITETTTVTPTTSENLDSTIIKDTTIDLLPVTSQEPDTSKPKETTSTALPSTKEPDSKECKKNICKNGGRCTKTEDGEVCTCIYPYGGKTCEESYWCSEGLGKKQCPDGKCHFNFTSGIGTCECPKDNYFNYEKGKCEVVDPCLLMSNKCSGWREICKNGKCQCEENYMRNSKNECVANFCSSKPFPCGENEVCEDILDAEKQVRCTCKEGYIFDGRKCQKVKECSLVGGLGCQHICNEEKKVCECHPGFILEADKKSCSPMAITAKCQKDCGVGFCVKTRTEEKCICPRTHVSIGSTCIDLCTARQLPPGLCPNNQCVSDDKVGFRCKCEGKLTLAENGVTCKKAQMCYAEGGSYACYKSNAICVDDFNSEKGYYCKCRDGQDFDKNGRCRRKCDLENYKEKCNKLSAVCEMENGNPVCKCQPLLTFGADGRCTEIAKSSYTGTLPIVKYKYDSLFASSPREGLPGDTVDYVALRKDIRDTMKNFHGENYKFADIVSCTSDYPVFNCTVEVQFKSDPRSQVQVIGDPKTCANNDKLTCAIPPRLLLVKKEMHTDMFAPSDPCMKEIKDVNCGTYNKCTRAKDGSKNFVCECGEGFINYGAIQPLSDKKTIIEKCEDIDECLDRKACPKNTRCLNTIGSYECLCQTGYRPPTPAANIMETGCVEMCDSKLCKHGHCEISDNVFRCKCDEGFTGLNCEEDLLPYKTINGMKIALIVLATIILPLTLLLIYVIHKYRYLKRKSKKSPSYYDNTSAISLQQWR